MPKFTQALVIVEKGLPDVTVPREAIPDTVLIKRHADGKRVIVGFLSPDEHAENPLSTDCGAGEIVPFTSRAQAQELIERARELGEFAVMLSCYRHSSERWSLVGEGHFCRWDTTRHAGYWFATKAVQDEVTETAREQGDDVLKLIKQRARADCAVYNQYLAGEVYGVNVLTFDATGKNLNEESCWGYIGCEHASAELKEWFERECGVPQNVETL